MNKQRVRDVLIGSLLGDAITLPAHWIYNSAKIVRDYQKIDKIISPIDNKYHGQKNKGDFTHYGDQTYLLLKHVVHNKDFLLEEYFNDWLKIWEHPEVYKDKATKETIANFNNGQLAGVSGSSSDDISAAGRVSPLLYLLEDKSQKEIIDYAVNQAMMTHNHQHVIDSTKFFISIALAVLDGQDIFLAILDYPYSNYETPLEDWISQAEDLLEMETTAAMRELGLTCHTKDAFPAIMYIVMKYADNLGEALVQNTMAGGDSAARGLIVGMLLAAKQGLDGLTSSWIQDLSVVKELDLLLP